MNWKYGRLCALSKLEYLLRGHLFEAGSCYIVGTRFYIVFHRGLNWLDSKDLKANSLGVE